MPKRIREAEDIYIAPDILGKYRNGQYIAIDERSNSQLDPNKIEHKIIIYERQVNDWFLKPTKNLINKKNSGFIILMVCMSHIEGIEQYRRGSSSNRNSKETFVASMNNILTSSYEESDLISLYKQSRIGLFHDGMVRGDIIIRNSFDETLVFRDRDILINPIKLLNDITINFEQYILNLKDENNQVLRENFDRMFSIVE